jgi:YidC/Oxa1 family membrane protein insertase
VSIQLAAWLASASSTTSTTAATAHKAGGSILDPIAKPIAWVLAGIYSVIPNYAVAIIVLSVLWMIIIAPLTLKTTRSMLAMQQLQPELKKLQEKHKDDRQAFAQAQMELFREHNVSPFGSCLPMLLPLPIFFGLYRVITGLSHHGANGASDPKYLSPGTQMYKDIVAAGGHLKAFGMDLSLNAFSHHATVWAALPYWILVLVLAGTGYLQSSQMMSRNPNASANPQMRLMKYLPLFLVVLFVRFPAGVLLYYAMSNVCRIVQQDAMYRFDPKVKALVVQEVREVEAHTHEIDEEQARGKKPPKPPADKPSAAKPPPGAKPPGAKPPAAKPPAANPSAANPSADGTSGGGSQSSAGAGADSTGGGSGSSGGRGRFRELLAAATEQQQKRAAPAKPAQTGTGSEDGGGDAASKEASASPAQPAPATGAKPPPASSNGGAASKRSTNGKPAGRPQSSTGKPPPKGSHRTNRKRRR